MKIDDKSLTPLFIQIADWIESEILNGNLAEEESIPSTNQLSSLYGINPATVRKGFDILTEEGLIYKKRGIGMYVCEGARDKIINKARSEFATGTISELVRDAVRLGLTKKELIKLIEDEESWGDR